MKYIYFPKYFFHTRLNWFVAGMNSFAQRVNFPILSQKKIQRLLLLLPLLLLPHPAFPPVPSFPFLPAYMCSYVTRAHKEGLNASL